MADKKAKKNDETPVEAEPADVAEEPTVDAEASSDAAVEEAAETVDEAAEEAAPEPIEEPVVEVAAEAVEPDAPAEEPAEKPAAEPVVEAAAEAVEAAEPEAAPAEEPAAEPVADPTAEVEPPAEETAAAEPEAPKAAPVAPAPQSGPKPKKKRLPRSLRPKRTRPTLVKPTDRKPIVRLEKPEHDRGRRQERQGTVISSAMDKTIVVKVDTLKAHRKYKKVVRRSTTFHAHDEANEANVGDVVRIVETRPISKTKRWRLAEIVEAAK
jgi:small subunit ribosomal protein S17